MLESAGRAQELAAAVGAEVISLADLASSSVVEALAKQCAGQQGYRAPVLANASSVGMQPSVEQTPVPLVCLILSLSQLDSRSEAPHSCFFKAARSHTQVLQVPDREALKKSNRGSLLS